MTNKTSKIPDENITRPHLSFYESWQDESGIDTGIWTPTNPATGTAWNIINTGPTPEATAAPNNGETCSLLSVHRWGMPPGSFGSNTILRKLILEFEMRFTNPANSDLAYLGLSRDNTPNEPRFDFGLTGGNPYYQYAVTGTSLSAIINGITLTDRNKFRVELSRNLATWHVNEAQVASSVPAAHTARPFQLFFYVRAAGGAITIFLGPIRLWTEDVIR